MQLLQRLDDLIWEREYHKVDWKDVPFRKTITEFMKAIDDEVLVPVNLGAFATLKEAKRLLAPDAVGFSAFDAGTADMAVLNDLDRFHLVIDVIDRVPKLGYKAAHLRQLMRDKLIEHRQYIERHGQDMPEILEWKWPAAGAEARGAGR